MTHAPLAAYPSLPEHHHGALTGRVSIRTLTSLDIPAFRALRLEALRLHPETFVPTYEEERTDDPATIARRFRNDWIQDGSFILGAYLDDWLVGAVGIRRGTRKKHRHKATVWLLYTHLGVRRFGIGRGLLDEAIARCQSDRELEVLQLTVGNASKSAFRLYASAGFEQYGVERHAMKLDDQYIDVTLMALDLVSKGHCSTL